MRKDKMGFNSFRYMLLFILKTPKKIMFQLIKET